MDVSAVASEKLNKNTNSNSAYSSSASDGSAYVTSNGASIQGFSYLYNNMEYENVVKEFVDLQNNLFITKFSPNNPYYKYIDNGGYSNALRMYRPEMANIVLGVNSSNYNDYYNAAEALGIGTVMSNCVGYANSRAKEVWNELVRQGYVTKVTDAGVSNYTYRINSTGATFEADPHRYQNNDTFPNANGGGLKAVWPYNKNGYNSSGSKLPDASKYTDLGWYWSDTETPRPGCLVTWRSDGKSGLSGLNGGTKGHVAFVESVHNIGQQDEYIVISQSGWVSPTLQYLAYRANLLTAKTDTDNKKKSWMSKKLATTQKIMKNGANNRKWVFDNNYEFVAFLYSPICDCCQTQQIVSCDVKDVSEKDKKSYDLYIQMLKGKTIIPKLNIGDKVKVKWFGNQKPDGTGKRLNIIGSTCTIKDIEKNKSYQYGLTQDGKSIIGYFKPEDLQSQ